MKSRYDLKKSIVEKKKLEMQKKEKKEFINKFFLRITFFLLLIVIWQLTISFNIVENILFPTPKDVALTLWNGLLDKTLINAIYASVKRLTIGYIISALIGIPLGLLLGRVKWLNETIGTLSLGLQALPSICWLPIAVLWFGLNEKAMYFVIIMGSLQSLTLTVRDGVKSIPTIYVKAAKVLGANGIKFYTHVLFPASLPSILTGARLGWTFAWRSLMAAELLYVSVGLGSVLTMGRELHDMALVVATMIVIIAIGLIFDKFIFGNLENYIHVRWGTNR